MLDRRTSEPWRLKKAGFAGAAADALGDQPGYFDLAIKTALTLGLVQPAVEPDGSFLDIRGETDRP